MEKFCQRLAEHVEGHDLAQIDSHITELWDTFLIADPILGETDVDYKSELLRNVLWLKRLIALLETEGKGKLLMINNLRKVV